MSMNHMAVIATVSDVREHPGADRLKLATCVGNQIVVGLDTHDGDLGVYFNCDLQLSHDYASANDLIRRKDEAGNNVGGMFDTNRRVRAQKLRGAISDGYFASLESLSLASGVGMQEINKLEEGTSFNEIGGIPICNKYVTESTKAARNTGTGPKPKESVNTVMFHKHIDTAHFGRNTHLLLNDPNGVLLIVTAKLHGTSQRVGHVQVARELSWVEKLLQKFNVAIQTTEWKHLVGTRNVTLTPKKEQTLFHSAEFRDRAARPFFGNLHKGETVYYEVVGYENGGKTIMNKVDIKKVKDKAFEKQYKRADGTTEMIFSYGCAEGQLAVYVYRITQTNEDGEAVDLSWGAVEQRCAEMGVKTVPVHYKACVNRENYEAFLKYADDMSDGPDTIDPSHIREGICIRLEDGTTPTILKHKSFTFKVLEGIIKDTGVEDMEEAA